jgi:NAD(P)-dependent dehydrogenase (short-subunit alcohol dehydrogenase family)
MPSDPFDLRQKVAVVTGSSRGIGFAIARALAERGARVVVSSRKPDACEAAVAKIRELDVKARGGDAMAVPCNIVESADLDNLITKTREAWGRVDILVGNAAISPYFGPALGMPDDKFDLFMRANVRANIHLCRLVVPEMTARRDGAIIMMSSVAVKKGNNTAGYSLTKAALSQLVRNLAVEHSPDNIRINAIAPGLVKTHFSRVLWEDPAALDKRLAKIPLRRIGEPEDIAGMAVLLASDAGSWITGQTFFVDGGDTIDI